MSKRLSVYLMAFPETPELAEAAVEGGADLLELGFPFSDPLADGPVIRLAGERALQRGMRTQRCLECLAETRARLGPDVPLIPMTYASILEAYGYERFWADARAAGATSLIVADLPLEAAPEVPRVQLVAPTSTSERIGLAAARTDGWLYLVSLTGTTGARTSASSQLDGPRRAHEGRHRRAAPRRVRHLDARSRRPGPPPSRTASSSGAAPCRSPTSRAPPASATTWPRCARPSTSSRFRLPERAAPRLAGCPS